MVLGQGEAQAPPRLVVGGPVQLGQEGERLHVQGVVPQQAREVLHALRPRGLLNEVQGRGAPPFPQGAAHGVDVRQVDARQERPAVPGAGGRQVLVLGRLKEQQQVAAHSAQGVPGRAVLDDGGAAQGVTEPGERLAEIRLGGAFPGVRPERRRQGLPGDAWPVAVHERAQQQGQHLPDLPALPRAEHAIFFQVEVTEGPQERRGGRVVLGAEVRLAGERVLGEQLVGEPQESLPSGRFQEVQDAGAQGAQVLLGFPRPQAGGQEQPVVLGLDGGKAGHLRVSAVLVQDAFRLLVCPGDGQDLGLDEGSLQCPDRVAGVRGRGLQHAPGVAGPAEHQVHLGEGQGPVPHGGDAALLEQVEVRRGLLVVPEQGVGVRGVQGHVRRAGRDVRLVVRLPRLDVRQAPLVPEHHEGHAEGARGVHLDQGRAPCPGEREAGGLRFLRVPVA